MATDPIRELVSGLIASDVHLYVDGAELKYRARKGAIREADRKRVKENKAAIIEYLSRLQQVAGEQSVVLPPIERVERNDDGLALSYGQQRLWFIDQFEGGSAHYNTQCSLWIEGQLDTTALEEALAALIDRHEVLRTCYVEVRGEPRQVVRERRSLPLIYRDLVAVRDEHKEEQLRQWMQHDVSTPFDLRKDLVLRASVITFAAGAHLMLVTMHHIAGDGWSGGIFEREFGELYDAHRSGRPARLSPLRVQYADYAVWQRGRFRETFIEKQLQYWKQRLDGAPLVHSLPLDKVRPPRQTFTGKLQQRLLPGDTAKAIKSICDAKGVTLFMLMQTAFAVLLGRYSCQKDIVMGVAVAGRVHHDLESMIGLFLNLLVLRTDLSGRPTFWELLERNKHVILEAHENQYVPFERIVEELCPERTLSHNALVQILFGVQNNERTAAEMAAGNGAGDGERSFFPISTHFDLKLDVLEVPEGLLLTWLHNDSLFADRSIEQLAESYEVLLSSIVADFAAGGQSRRNIDSLELVGAATRKALAAQENTCIQRGGLVHGLFEAEVAANPQAVAVVYESLQLTYEELNARANRLAHLLLQKGVEPDSFVVLSLKRSVDMLVGLLAILKAGAAYVPVDPELPEARVSYIVSDCKPRLVLSLTSFRDRFSIDESRIVCLDDAATIEQLKQCAASNPRIGEELLSPENLAYAIYTSGSTGKPKGVLVSHDNVCDFLVHAVADFLPDHVAGAVVSSTLSFDATVGSLLVPICGGRYAELLPDDAFVLDRLCDCLSDDEEAMLFKLTPSHLEAMAAHGYMRPNPGGRHVLVVAGEPLLPSTLAHWSTELLPSSLFINEYGPTETTVGSTTHVVDQPSGFAEGRAVSVPIGKAFGDMQLYVLNDELRLQCPGGIGELFIGGAGVARGYLNRPALTAEKFLPNPFSTRAGSRVYRSGDLARQLPDGSIEYIGRIDYQVKIRGIRVELGEIESYLLQLPEVSEAIVLAQAEAGGGTHLTAYLVIDDSASNVSDDYLKASIKERLSRQLPAYMVPEVYVLLDELPLNNNGKIDRSALPAASGDDLIREPYVPPSNPIEADLCRLWQTLLQVERVGIFDNFFSLGGHSLLATRLVSSIRHEFGIELQLRALFESPTIAGLSKLLVSADRSVLSPVTRVPRDQPLPLSFSQQRLWFIDQLGQGSVHFNLPGYFLLHGWFREDAFQRALKSLLDRHEVLRTRFATVEGEARQIVVDDFELPFTAHDLTAWAGEEKAIEVERLTREEAARPFDLSADLMLRVRWLQLAEDVHLIVYTLHHIASDGWSRVILQRELSQLYAAYCKDEPDPLPPLPIQYADYAVWQRQWLQGEVLEQALSYWKQRLADLPAVHSLPLDKPRPAQQRHVGRTHRLLIGSKLAAGIAELNRQHNTTLFMFMHTAFALLLSRCSGERDIVVGGTITGRTHRDVEGLIGFFINDLALRLKIEGTPGFTELLKQHRETILDAYAHRHVPFEMLVEELNPPRSMSYGPLFQIKLDVQNNEEARLSLVDLELLNAQVEAQSSQDEREHSVRHDLYVSVSEQQTGVSVQWRYNTDLFVPETIARLSAQFETLLEGIVASPHESVYRLPLLTKDQQQRLLMAGQGPHAAYPQGKCLHELFEAQVERSPDEIAVVAGDATLTFRQVNQRANQLAHYLVAHGVNVGSRVALCTERSLDMVVGLLGILKAGAAYLPLDPAHPPARLSYMVEDSGCRWVLTQRKLMNSVSWGERQVLAIDVPLENYGEHNPTLDGMTSGQLAYVIYTSGSTGQPKGVMVEHDGVVRYCDHARERYYTPDLAGSVVATSYGFDLTVPTLYLPLLAGGHLRLLEEGRELEALAGLLANAQRPYLLRLTPSHVTAMLPLLTGRQSACAHALVIGGEALPVPVVHALRTCLPQAKIYNHYGPTESIVGCSLLPLTEETTHSAGYYPIGTALGHKQLLVLNAEMQLEPPGAPGQLFVGGDALARGYLGQPALTAQKFCSHPFSDSEGARLYATGDRVRWRPDGNLEFLGRLDQQVKIRGLRIELGEIEQALLALPGVRECVVSVWGEDQRLVAYVVPEDPASDTERLIESYRDGLGQRLPAYMVPQIYIFLPRLPLTVHGKLDRESLPAPDESHLLKQQYVAPRSASEEKMCALWQQVLKVERVGIEDNFFLLGGHSLLATRLVNLIRQEFATELPLRALFESPTIAGLSKLLASADRSVLSPVTRVPRDRPLPLSFSQQRLWFIDQLGQGSVHYNLPGYFLLHGWFREDAFQRALKSLLDRHEVLRTRFATVEGEARQIVVDDFELPFTAHDLTGWAGEEKAIEVERLTREEAARPFDLGADLMLRVRWLQLAEDVHLIVYTLHHIASDGWSRVILQRELSQLYAAYCKDEPDPLPALPIQYADYAVWQRQWLQGEVLERALSYWKQQLADLPAVHSLPLDKPRPAQQRHVGRTHRLLIGSKLAAGIAELNRRHNTTLFMFMHTAFALLLSRCSGERDIVVGGTITGRTHRDVEGLIGFFINDLALRLRIEGTPAFTELLKQHRETILDAYAHRHVPFEMLVEELNPPRSMSYGPLFQIKLDVQNNEEARLSLVDLELLNAQVEAQSSQDEREHSVRHDLYVSVSEQQTGVSVQWRYNTDLFVPETIARLSAQFETLLEGIVASPHESVYRLPLLTKDQQQRLLMAGQGPHAAYPQGKCLHELFEAQVERSPDETAVVFSDRSLTFRQLNQQANQLAHYLVAHGVNVGARVALCTERSLDMVVGLLAILKAGAAYLPLDPAHPPARLSYMVEDSGCRWVVTQRKLMNSASWGERQVLAIDAPLENYGEHNPALEGMTSRQLAYVIYTSGSTGQPKGVMVEHDGVVRYCDHARERYYTPDLAGSVVATSYGFDLTVPTLYLPLLAGGHLRLLEEGRELEALADLLANAQRPYLLRLTPSHVTAMLPLLTGRQSACAHALVIGGEALPVSVVHALRTCLPQAKIYNHYGPTESIVGCSLLPLTEETTPSAGYYPIGTALGHKQLLVLNTEMQLEPPGAPGQLYVGGDALARGYLGQPALTAQKFCSHPFSDSEGARLYATGDRVRWRPDGNLEFLGRLDQQVKIRGLRIELGEIEQALLALPGVRECVVTVSGEEQRLVAYVVPEDPASDTERLIENYRDGLSQRLPAYMVPTAYIVMERIPLTTHGKIDRKKLPAPAEQDLHKAVYVAPGNEVESTLCLLWQEILRVERVGVDDSFFALGGHSLLAVRTVSRIREVFQVELPVRSLFEKTTVGQLAVEVMEHLIANKSGENQQRMMASDDAVEEIL